MSLKKSVILILSFFVLAGNVFSEQVQRTLVGWGIDKKNTDHFLTEAEEVGFDVLITWSTDPVFLEKAVKLGEKHNIKIFSCLSPMAGMASLWKKKYPQKPFPWQKMNEDETAAEKFLSAGKNKYIVPYQWGGEPLMTNEVLLNKIICFGSEERKELFKPIIDRIVSVPGIAGIAFDGFGYQNFNGCHCQKCQKALADYCKTTPEMNQKEATVHFYRDTLVHYINDLADYARSKNKDIKTTIHIWPVFAADPLYGNRLDLDYCGQTAAWYTLWPKEKIAAYSRIISEQAKKYHQRQEGVAMIGYYDRPGQFPVKKASCVDMELSTMIKNGCSRIQVCGANDVIQNKEVAEVFKKYFK